MGPIIFTRLKILTQPRARNWGILLFPIRSNRVSSAMEAAENVGTEPKAAVPEAAAVEDGRERHDRELKDGLHPLKVSNFFLLCSR